MRALHRRLVGVLGGAMRGSQRRHEAEKGDGECGRVHCLGTAGQC